CWVSGVGFGFARAASAMSARPPSACSDLDAPATGRRQRLCAHAPARPAYSMARKMSEEIVGWAKRSVPTMLIRLRSLVGTAQGRLCPPYKLWRLRSILPLQEAHLLPRQMFGERLAERWQRAVLLLDQRHLAGEIRITDAPRAQGRLGRYLAGRSRYQGDADASAHHAERRHHIGRLGHRR